MGEPTSPVMAAQASPMVEVAPVMVCGIEATPAPVAVEATPAPVAVVEDPVKPAVINATSSQGPFIVQQVGKVPVIGGYATPLLQSRYLKPITERVDPYVVGGVQ